MNKYLLTKRFGVIKLTLIEDVLWRDEFGTVFALQDLRESSDKIPRCGVWPVVLPEWMPFTDVCVVHDFMYSSPAYQVFNTRREADDKFRELLGAKTKDSWYSIFTYPLYLTVRVFGGFFWEERERWWWHERLGA